MYGREKEVDKAATGLSFIFLPFSFPDTSPKIMPIQDLSHFSTSCL